MMKQLTIAQIMQTGVDQATAQLLLPQINQELAMLSAIDCWQHLTQFLLKPSHPFALHQLLYETTFADWKAGPPPAWIPSAAQIQATHLAALMRELQIGSYAALHDWSIHDRAAFWEVIIQRLGIRFRHPYSQILDLSQGIENPQWLVNAQLNIVESCFQAPEDASAIIIGSEVTTQLKIWTYRELQCLTNRIVNGLVNFGFQPGDAIAIDLPMTAEAVAIYLGIVKAGCVVVSIADSFAAAEIATRLRITNAKAIFTQDVIQRCGKCLPLYAKVIEANAPTAIVLSSNKLADVKLRLGDMSWSDFLTQNETFEAVPMPSAAHTNILFSSGTTGDPKAIPWTQTTPIKSAADAYLHHDIHPGDVVAWPTNLGWMMGPWLIYASLINCATIALYEGAPTTRGYGQFIEAAQVNMLGVVPSLVNLWKTSNCMQGLDWSCIKAFSSTGECSHPQDMLFLMSMAGYKPIIEYCGGTEIGGGYITGTLIQPCAPATFTTPALGLDLVILDANGQPADKGEGWIVPPAIGLSTELLNQDHHRVYFADAPNSFVPLRRHGDHIERLPNGYYRVCGRVDDTMNLGGIKVSSAEIEQVINRVDGVRETAAIAFSPAEGGPGQLVIYAVLMSGLTISSTALHPKLQQAIAQQLNPLFKIRDVVIVPELPRTASNKVMRRTLRNHYQAIAAEKNALQLTNPICDRNSRLYPQL